MPRPCAVESHARRYKTLSLIFQMPRPCAVEPHVCSYKKRCPKLSSDATASHVCSYGKIKLECTRYLTNVHTVISTSRTPLRILLSSLSAISDSWMPTVLTV